MSNKARSRQLGTLLLLVALPLVYSPLTADLRTQKSLLFALALPLCAFGAPSSAGLLSLLVGLGWLLASPDQPWTILAFFAAPTILSCLSIELEQDPARIRRILRRVCLAVCVAALLGAVGLLPLDTSAFHLPYRVLVGTLGNPNHLSAFLVLSFPLIAQDLSAKDKPTRVEAMLALVVGALVVLLCRSHLAAIALAAQIVLAWPKRPALLVLAAATLAPLFLSLQSFTRAFEGRLYLLRVHASGFSLKTLFLGVSPSALSAQFLEWQAVHLEKNPHDARFWTFPEHPHNDVLAALLSFGLLTTLVAWLLARRRFAFSPKLDPALLRAGLGSALVFALGLGLSSSPVLITSTLLLVASTLKPSDTQKPQLVSAQTIAASAWLFVMLADAYAAFEEKRAVQAAVEQRDLTSALKHAQRARLLPFERARREHLLGRVLLAKHDPEQAAIVLRDAATRLAHPTIFKTLLAAEEQRGDEERARVVALAWLRVRPLDAEAREAIARHSGAK